MIAYKSNINWDEVYGAGRSYVQLSKSAVDNLLIKSGVHGGSALDIGCGTGSLVRELKSKGFKVTGIDLSAVAIGKAHDIYADSAYIIGDIFSTDFVGKFDLVSCKYVYALIKDKKAFLEKVCTLLSDDGCFAIITPSVGSVPAEKKAITVESGMTIAMLLEHFESVEHIMMDKDDYYFCRFSKADSSLR